MSLKIQAANDEKINNGTDHPKIQMISNFLSSAWSSLWTKEFIFCFSAAIGGLVVLCGLWLEYVSTDEKRYEKADIDGFRSLKSKEKCGEIWVMVGIWIEVAVAMLFAGIDVWDKHEINKNAAQNDPHNFIILSVLGYAISIILFWDFADGLVDREKAVLSTSLNQRRLGTPLNAEPSAKS